MCKNSLREGTVFVYYQDHQTFRGFVDLVEGADLRSALILMEFLMKG